jgi:hypothetical protein
MKNSGWNRLPRATQPQVARARPAAVPAAYEIVRGIISRMHEAWKIRIAPVQS